MSCKSENTMTEDHRPFCPIPHLGCCIYDRCNFWDEEKQECSGEGIDEYTPLDDTAPVSLDSPCTIQWTEDYD
jgi:hypothetical protein